MGIVMGIKSLGVGLILVGAGLMGFAFGKWLKQKFRPKQEAESVCLTGGGMKDGVK